VNHDYLQGRGLKRLHYWFGFIGLVSFLLTGQYMYHVHNHLAGMPDGARMLFRSSHIYLLLVSIINLVIGVYWQQQNAKFARTLQWIASCLVFLASLLLLAGFFTEPYLHNLDRPYSRIGLYALFAVALLYIGLGLMRNKRHEPGSGSIS
jgi:hypothetical protein